MHSLAAAAAAQDRVQPLSEAVRLVLTDPRPGGDTAGRHLLVPVPDGGLAGYAFLDPAGGSAELVIDPAHRRQGHGRALMSALLHATRGRDLRVWAHGRYPGAEALAASLGLQQVRELWQLRRQLDDALPEPALPPGVTVRTFRPGPDDEPWLELNRRAFAGHPEQGAWTAADLHRRVEAPWFDPEGFFLAEDHGELVGFHWTKVHARDDRGATHEPIGEVYVLGVDPRAHGRGLGRALTTVGLRHLRSRGLAQVLLYVDADNVPAVEVYRRLGFARWDADVMFSS